MYFIVKDIERFYKMCNQQISVELLKVHKVGKESITRLDLRRELVEELDQLKNVINGTLIICGNCNNLYGISKLDSDEILYYHCFKCLCNRTPGDAPLDDNCWEKREDR